MIEWSKLILGYAGKTVLRVPDRVLQAQSQWLICGPSGCGKTTLLYALAGMIVPMGGNLRVTGENLAAMGESARDVWRGQHIGLVLQSLHLVPALSVLENLMLASYLAGLPQDMARAKALLARLGMTEKANALPAALSQGQAQRVAIARAVLHRPALLLADEPTASLDDTAAAEVIALLRETAAEQKSVLIVSTHDARIKPDFTHRVDLGAAA